jgi:hypothetical protein
VSAEGMIDSDDTQPPAPRRNRVLDALKRAEAEGLHPARAEIRKGSGEIPSHAGEGVHQGPGGASGRLAPHGAAQRREADDPAEAPPGPLVEETGSEWQPQVRARAREQASTSSGMMVEVTAYFGFTCTGNSDDGRIRTITTPISPTYARQILDLQEAGATEEDLHPIVAEAVTESYFTEWGTRSDGLRADLTHVQAIEFMFWLGRILGLL